MLFTAEDAVAGDGVAAAGGSAVSVVRPAQIPPAEVVTAGPELLAWLPET